MVPLLGTFLLCFSSSRKYESQKKEKSLKKTATDYLSILKNDKYQERSQVSTTVLQEENHTESPAHFRNEGVERERHIKDIKNRKV